MHVKKAAAVFAASGLVLGLAACGDSGSEGASGSSGGSGGSGGDNYVVAFGVEPQNPLIPGDTNENGGGRIIDEIYAGLKYYDAEGKAHNDLAKSIDLEGDKTYKVTLREDAK